MKETGHILRGISRVLNNNFKVIVVCYTFNQSSYIEETLKGFVIQQTKFPFICVVTDDCSTDGESRVLTNYISEQCDNSHSEEFTDALARVVVTRSKYNVNCFFVFNLLKRNLYKEPEKKRAYIQPWRELCEYEAFCEGDDYWITRDKLQKQVDFLEASPEYGLVRTNINRLYQKDGKIEKRFFDQSAIKDTYHDFIINSWWVAPCTWVYRESLVSNMEKDQRLLDNIGGFSGDLAMLLSICKQSKVKYMDEVTTVYRILEVSASHFDNREQEKLFYKRIRRTRRYFASKDSFITRINLELYFFYRKIRSYAASIKRINKNILSGRISTSTL